MAKRSHKTLGRARAGAFHKAEPPQIIAGLGVDLPELRRARALWAVNRTDEALALFEEAVRTHPQNLVALVDASRALGARFEIARAEVMLDRLLRAAQGRPDLLHLAGQSYRMIFRPEKAMDCFRRVVAATTEIPDAYLELAVLYERRHRLDEAFALAKQCLSAAPDYLEVKLFMARLLRRLKDESASESLFRELADNERAAPEVRAQAWAELAQGHDRHQEYELAMKAMLKSKEHLLAREEVLWRQAETVMSDLRNLIDTVTAAQYRAWQESTATLGGQALAVLTGFPRSGTTLLEQVLDSHPGLVSSDEREAFARDIFPAIWSRTETPRPTAAALDAAPLERIGFLRGRYLNYMTAALNTPIGQRIHLDKNPTLTVILPGFLRLFPEAKVLVALRDPRDVIVSCFMQYLPLNSNSVYFLSLERAAKRYANDLGLWRKMREKIVSPWLEVRYEDTVANMEREARRTLEFLGLAWDPSVLDYRSRLQEKAVASPTYEAVSQPIYTRSVGRWKNYEKYLEPCLPTLQPFLGAFGY